jgi:hypothetical protein
MIRVQDFIADIHHVFGENQKLPIAVWYSDAPAGEEVAMPHCMFEALPIIERGTVVTFSKDKLHCGGGRLYCGFHPYNTAIGRFVSNTESYKKTPEMVDAYVSSMDIRLADKPYVNFGRIDKIESWNGIEGIVFLAEPDVLSGLCSWAFYDNNDESAVSSLFTSGCASFISLMTTENRRKGRRTFLGMMDLSARPWIKPTEMSFAIPLCRLQEMMDTLHDCALYSSPAWQKLKERIVNRAENKQSE